MTVDCGLMNPQTSQLALLRKPKSNLNRPHQNSAIRALISSPSKPECVRNVARISRCRLRESSASSLRWSRYRAVGSHAKGRKPNRCLASAPGRCRPFCIAGIIRVADPPRLLPVQWIRRSRRKRSCRGDQEVEKERPAVSFCVMYAGWEEGLGLVDGFFGGGVDDDELFPVKGRVRAENEAAGVRAL